MRKSDLCMYIQNKPVHILLMDIFPRFLNIYILSWKLHLRFISPVLLCSVTIVHVQVFLIQYLLAILLFHRITEISYFSGKIMYVTVITYIAALTLHYTVDWFNICLFTGLKPEKKKACLDVLRVVNLSHDKLLLHNACKLCMILTSYSYIILITIMHMDSKLHSCPE